MVICHHSFDVRAASAWEARKEFAELLFSVIIPGYNRVDIRQKFSAVLNRKHFDHGDSEIIVIDESPQIARSKF